MRRTIALAAVAILAGLVWVLPAWTQQDMQRVPNAAFTKPQRQAALFAHDEHNEKAKIEDCGLCHHGETNGKMDKENQTPGQPCVECHPVKKAAGKTPLMRAFHKQCQGCHQTSGKGPLACGECHN